MVYCTRTPQKRGREKGGACEEKKKKKKERRTSRASVKLLFKVVRLLSLVESSVLVDRLLYLYFS